MELIDAIKKRRSVRNFESRPVDRPILEKLIEAANEAPSACNVQGWKFIVVDDDKIKNKIVAAGGSVIIKNAPIGILVLYDNRTKNFNYADHVQSASAAIENLILSATDLGLGACWVCHLPMAGYLRRIFCIPAYFSPVAYILVGYPKISLKPVARKYSLSEIMHYNSFSADWPVERVSLLSLRVKKLLIRFYYLMPNFIKKNFLNKIIDRRFVKKFDN